MKRGMEIPLFCAYGKEDCSQRIAQATGKQQPEPWQCDSLYRLRQNCQNTPTHNDIAYHGKEVIAF